MEAGFREKIKRLSSNKAVLLFFAFFLFHIIGILWSSDYTYALKDIRIKLVLLLIPLILASSRSLDHQQIKLLLQLYIVGVLVISFFSFWKYLGWSDEVIIDKRQLSIRISHIRYGLMIAFAAFCCIYYALKNKSNWRFIYFCLAAYFVISLLLFQFYTGITIFFIISSLFLLKSLFEKELSIFAKILSAVILSLMISIPAIIFYDVYKDFRYVPDEFNYDQDALNVKTESGNTYTHNLELPYKENGYYVWRFINYGELEREWEKRSELPFDSRDKKGQELKHTLIRYMTSLGLKKDSAGISKMRDKDIAAIEQGIANVYFVENNHIKGRIHSTLYEIKNYRKYEVAEGFSIAMRLEYWKTALKIIDNNTYFGVGTGDIQKSFNELYRQKDSLLRNKDYWRRSHNQYLSSWVQLGIPGFVLLILMLFYPLFQRGTKNNFLFLAFIALSCLSMLTEDSLETQAGATLFTVFYSLFLFNPKP